MENSELNHLFAKRNMKRTSITVIFSVLSIVLMLCTSLISLKNQPVHSKTIHSGMSLEDTTGLSDECFFNGTLTNEERKSISLFKYAKKVKVISFSRTVVRSIPIDKNKIASKYLKDEITLTEAQIDSLTQILYNYNYSKYRNHLGGKHMSCYEPRHAIVFLNSTDKVMGYFELCFSCWGHRTLPTGENAGVFCEGKYQLIEDFFKSVGVTFFEEIEEE